MIDLPLERVEKVRAFLAEVSTGDLWRFEATHRAPAQSYQVYTAQIMVARYIGAMSYLLIGEPSGFDDLGPDDGMPLATRLFIRDSDKEPGTPTRGLLYEHAHQVLTLEPMRMDSYIDLEAGHLTLLGGELLFGRIVEAMVTPYHERPEGDDVPTDAESVFRKLSSWLTPGVIAIATRERRHWSDWDTTPESD
jgi:hypothetical protein